MKHSPASGFVYVIATGKGGGLDAGREIESRLLRAGGAPDAVERRQLPGILWGFVPDAGDRPGDRLTSAAAGKLEAVLRGDPVWIEPRATGPASASQLLSAWEEEGPGAVRFLDNSSLALVADAGAGAVTLATDRMGGIPLYSSVVRGARVLCTSYLALSRIVESKAVDGDSLACFFHLGYFPGTRTALRDVELVPFASTAAASAEGIRIEPYWRPAVEIDRGPLDDQLHAAVRAFNDTVREYSAGCDRMYVAMTAGLDSRTVAASLLRQHIPFETYTHGFPGCWEGKRVTKIVRRHAIPHRFVPLVGGFTSRVGELARESFRASEGTISCIEKGHLLHVLSLLREDAPARAGLLLGGGAGMIKGTFYRLLDDEEPFTSRGVDRYITWNFAKKLPAVFSPEVPAGDRRALREFVTRSLEECGGGSFFQRLDYLYIVRYRRWAGGVKHIYRDFFPTREPFISAHMIDYLFPLDPAVKDAKKPHFAILAADFPALQHDLTNKMTPALPLTPRTFHRFLPSAWWRTKQVLRGFSRRYLPRELFPLIDYVDYKRWIRMESGRALVDDLLDPPRMKSARLYDERALKAWLDAQRADGFGAFSLIDKMCTLELYFREIEAA